VSSGPLRLGCLRRGDDSGHLKKRCLCSSSRLRQGWRGCETQPMFARLTSGPGVRWMWVQPGDASTLFCGTALVFVVESLDGKSGSAALSSA